MGDARLLIDTLRLAPPADPGALTAAWARADAGALVRLAEYEGVELWLHRRLKALDVALDGVPGQRLAALAKRAVAQSLRVDTETAAALDTLGRAGIPAVPIKGAAMRRLAARVAYADARAPNDVDLLVPAEAAQRAWDALVAHGYSAPRETGPPDGHHLPALVGPVGVGVELHLTTVAAVPPAEAWRRATGDGAGADVGAHSRPAPSDTELLWHAVAHALVHAQEAARFGARLRYWLDAAALLASGAAIDWERIRDRLDSPETPRPALARAWLAAAAGLSGRALPAGALGTGTAPAFDVERLVSWRLRVFAGGAPDGRWPTRLIEEGARGEALLPPEPGRAGASAGARLRHALAARAARLWWILRR